jgi:hypothetical protein
LAANKIFEMEKLISREVEKKLLQDAIDSGAPELIALFGRRRVGKTLKTLPIQGKQGLILFIQVQ